MQYLKVKGNLKPKVQLTGMCLRAFILQIEISPLPKTVWELMHCFVVLFTQELVALDGLKSHVNDAGSSNFRWDVMNDRIPRLRSFSNGGQWSFLSIFFYPANLKYLWSKNCLSLIHGERMHDFRYNGNLFVFHIQHKHFKLLWFTAYVRSSCFEPITTQLFNLDSHWDFLILIPRLILTRFL